MDALWDHWWPGMPSLKEQFALCCLFQKYSFRQLTQGLSPGAAAPALPAGVVQSGLTFKVLGGTCLYTNASAVAFNRYVILEVDPFLLFFINVIPSWRQKTKNKPLKKTLKRKKRGLSISSYSSYKTDQSKFEGKFFFLACHDIRKPNRFEKHVI